MSVILIGYASKDELTNIKKDILLATSFFFSFFSFFSTMVYQLSKSQDPKFEDQALFFSYHL